MIIICEVARPIYVMRKRALNFVEDLAAAAALFLSSFLEGRLAWKSGQGAQLQDLRTLGRILQKVLTANRARIDRDR